VEDDSEASIQAAPGEAIRIQTAGAVSVDTVYACLRPEAMPASSCQFDALISGYVTAPQKGTWILSLYGKDQAGNEGPILERRLQIFDSNLVSTIRAYVEQSALSQKSGAFLQSLIFGVKAYEKMKTLGSKAEIQSVASAVRKSILESIAMPIEQLVIKLAQNQITLSVALVQSEGQPSYVLGNGWHSLDYIQMNGEKKFTLDLSQTLKIAKEKVSYRFCDATQSIVAAGGSEVSVIKDGVVLASFPLAQTMESSMISVSQDCNFATMEITGQENKRRRMIVDLANGELFEAPSEAYYITGLLKTLERKKVIMESLSNVHYLVDLSNNFVVKLSESLGISEIRQVQKARDGSTGILTQDQNFHIVGQDGQLVYKVANASSFQNGLVSDEFVVFTDAYNVRIINSSGVQRANVSVGPSSWSYLTANSEFLVGMSAGSNVVKIWTRAGNNYDEIYNKGDSVRKVLLSEDGYLLVESAQYHKIFRLKNEIARKQAPEFVHAVGLQFSPDGHELFYKEQQPTMVEMQNTADNNLVKWNLKDDRKSVYALPQLALASRGYPGYGAQTRDLQLFSQNGRQYLAAAVKRGTIVIFEADKPETAIESYELTSNWLLDIAVDPSGNLLAGASQNGLVFLVGRKNGGFGATSLTDVYPQYFEEYPVTLNFDSTGRYLFVTDLNRNLMKYSISFDEQAQSYALTLESKVSEAGVNLAINSKGDVLALVGQGAKLRLFDADLRPLKDYELSSSSITLGQSVTFSPDGSKIYAGVYDGTWNELDRKTGQLLKVRFSSNETGATNLVVSPKGDQIAFMGGGFVQLADLNVDRVYKKMCAWLAPRLPYIPDLTDEDRKLCAAP
jgi:WD40 repeat protein